MHTDASFGGIRRYSKPAKKKSDTPEVEVRKCVRTAAERIVELRVSGYPWIFETDIESFFPSINRKRLFRDLSLSLRDDSINDLIEASLDTSVANVDDLGVLADLWNPEMGVPQGGVLSPVLANFYLYEHDRQMTAAGFKLIRYVDDLIVLATSEREAHEAYRKCEMVLKTLDLHIHPLGQESNGRIKTNIHRPNEPFEFLGLTFASSSIQPTHKKMDKLREKLLAITECKGSRLKLREVIERLNWCVTGWVKAYDFCNLSRKQLQEIDALVGHYVRRWLVHRGIIAKMNKLDAKAFSWLGIKCAQDIHLKPIMRRSGRDEQDQQKRVAAGDSLLSLTAN